MVNASIGDAVAQLEEFEVWQFDQMPQSVIAYGGTDKIEVNKSSLLMKMSDILVRWNDAL